MSSFRIPFDRYNRFREWIGHEGHVVTKEGEPYEGKVYPKVSHYRSIKIDGAEPVTEYHDDIPF
jgi:hypothetical protein